MAMVAFVVPTFRRPGFLAECLPSLLAQTWTDLEVLVCDNAADPQTRAVVRAQADPRVRYLPRPHDLGMLRNAVEGFRATDAPFVAKVDDDDTWEPDAVASLLAPLRADPSLTVAFASFDLVDAAGTLLPDRTLANERYGGRTGLAPGRHAPFTDLAAAGTVGLACALMRRDAIDWDDVPDGVATAYDHHLALQCARRGAGAWYEPGFLARYRVHAGSDTVTATRRQVAGSLYATERALARGEHDDAGALAAAAQRSSVALARLLLREGETRQARAVLKPALRRAATRRDTGSRADDARLARLALLARLPGGMAQRVALSRATS